MRITPVIRAADLGPKTAAFTGVANGRPIAIVNRTALIDPAVRDEAAHALIAAGFDAGCIMDALLHQS